MSGHAPEEPERQPSLKRRAYSGVLWSMLEIWGRQAGYFIVFVVLARLLTPADFGLVAAARIFLDLTQVFIRQGLSDALVQRRDIRPDHLDTAFWTNVAIGVAAMAICIGIAPAIERMMGIKGLGLILIAMSPSMLIVSLNVVQDGLLRRELNFKPLAVRRIVGTLIGGIAGVSLALANYGAWSLVGQLLIGGFSSVAFLWLTTSWRPGFQITRTAFRDLYSFSVHILVSNIVALASKRADTFLIGRYLGATALGIYDVASRVMWALVMALTSVTNRVSFSAFSRINHEPERVRSAFYELTSWTALICFPCFAGVALLAPWIVPLVFGEQWLGSVPVMQVITWLGIPQSLAYFNSTILRAMGKPKLSLIILCLGALWNIVGFLIVVEKGIVAVAWIFLAGGITLLPIGVYWVRSLIGLSWLTYLRNLLPSVICTLAMTAVLHFAPAHLGLEQTTAVNLFSLIAIGFVTYAVAVLIVAPRKAIELLKRIRSLRSKKKKKKAARGAGT